MSSSCSHTSPVKRLNSSIRAALRLPHPRCARSGGSEGEGLRRGSSASETAQPLPYAVTDDLWHSSTRGSRLPQQKHAHPCHPQRDYRGKDDGGDPGKPDGFSRVRLYQADRHRADAGTHNYPPQSSGVRSAPSYREAEEDEGDVGEENFEQGCQGEVDGRLG